MSIMISRIFWIAATGLNLLLGIIGLILPVMPASPFFILTIICLKKASPEFHQRIVKSVLMAWLLRKVPVLNKWVV
jgi:uncharacterized membrane protein YbaN (DUF454 family)